MSVLIVDASNMAYRARYSYSLSFRGKDTSVTYGVLRMLMALIKEHKPESIIMCFDGGSPNYRKRLVPDYKTNRKHDDDLTFLDYLRQLGELQTMLPYFGMLCVVRCGIEADDLMFHASRMLDDSIIVTNDEDLLQAVNDNTAVLRPGKKESVLIDDINFVEKMGVRQELFLFYKAMVGDSSDCVPGVRGIGPKTALRICNQGFGGLNDNLVRALNEWAESGTSQRAIDCINLESDLCGARMALVNAPWRQYDDKTVYKYCIDNAFASLIGAGSLKGTFNRLCRPTFQIDNRRFPCIWDYTRYPV